MRTIGKAICDNCGETIFRKSFHIETFGNLDISSDEAYATSLAQLEDVSIEVAKSWTHHHLLVKCKTKEAYCKYCNFKHKTWQATTCLDCGKKTDFVFPKISI